MTIEAWLAFAATATALLLVPHPLASQTATFSRSWGRVSACITVPASTIAILLAGTIAAAAVLSVTFFVPALATTLSWAGLAYLMLYVLYAFQDPQLKHGLADNDNLPETKLWRILGFFVRKAFRGGRYLALAAALVTQFSGEISGSGGAYLEILAAFAVAAAITALIHALFPRLSSRKRRRITAPGQASHKPRTLFIARRAVTAGYRRIAA